VSTTTLSMLKAHPAQANVIREKLAATIDELVACAQACTACADACMSESTVAQLTKCVRTTMDCADMCRATARVLSRHTGFDADISRPLLLACAVVCTWCGDESGAHADTYQHCRVCAQACRSCEEACRKLLGALLA
jgi:Domain of Unknown Function (DUF326)